MMHHKKNRKFGREKGLRKALIQSLARSLILKGKMKTTEAKAKELRPFIEKLITRSKDGSLNSHRLLISRLNGKKEAKKLIDVIGPKYLDRKGGYTRIVKLTDRQSDGSKMAIIELITDNK